MTDNKKQNMIGVSEEEFQAIAAFFLKGDRPLTDEEVLGLVASAEGAVLAIAARLVENAMAEKGAFLAMETKTSEGNIIQLPIAKKMVTL